MSEPVEAKPAWILGWEAGASSVAAILTDLIAELREVFDTHPLAPSLTASVRACMDAAETRLQGVHDE